MTGDKRGRQTSHSDAAEGVVKNVTKGTGQGTGWGGGARYNMIYINIVNASPYSNISLNWLKFYRNTLGH